jgi:hypothetical protein
MDKNNFTFSSQELLEIKRRNYILEFLSYEDSLERDFGRFTYNRLETEELQDILKDTVKAATFKENIIISLLNSETKYDCRESFFDIRNDEVLLKSRLTRRLT